MIVLDTNVISESRRMRPNPHVALWQAVQLEVEIFVTATIASELLFGAHGLPEGRRQRTLVAETIAILDEDFPGRVLPFDLAAAEAYARIMVARERLGRPISIPDAQIAACCLSRGAVLATRNVRDFEGFGVELVNPWEFAG